MTLVVPSAENSAAVAANIRVRTAAKTVGEKQNVNVSPGRDQQRPEIVHIDRDSRSQRERGSGVDMAGQRTVSRGVFSAWQIRSWRSHQL